MGPIFRKLNLKDQADVAVVGAPASFEPVLAEVADRRVVRDLADVEEVAFALVFAASRAELDPRCAELAAKAVGDAVLWVAYPKKSSKRYRADIDRDHGWDVLGAAGFEPVRQVSIDEDWSALRFRRVEHIQTFTRPAAGALSDEGRRRGR